MTILNLIGESSALLPTLHGSGNSVARRLLTAFVMSCCLLLTLTPLRAVAVPTTRSQVVKKKVHKVSSKPKAASKPKASSKPKATSKPKASSKPKATGKPKASSKPKATSKLKASSKPKATSKPKASSKPKATSKPKASSKPKATSKPKASSKVKATSKPKVSSKVKTTSKPKVSSKKKPAAPAVKLSFAAQQRAKNRELLKHHPVKVVATSYGDKPRKTASASNLHSSAAERRANRKLIAQHPDWFSHRQTVAPDALGSDSIALAYRDHLHRTTQKAMSTLMKQLGKPYVWGGTSPKIGFDCSGLVYFAYHGLLTEGIPRTANGMYRWARGKKVAQNQLKRGDLIFFRIHSRSNADHVGVYLGNGKFIESPRTGKDIRISTLSDSFWQNHYLGAKRVLTPETII